MHNGLLSPVMNLAVGAVIEFVHARPPPPTHRVRTTGSTNQHTYSAFMTTPVPPTHSACTRKYRPSYFLSLYGNPLPPSPPPLQCV